VKVLTICSCCQTWYTILAKYQSNSIVEKQIDSQHPASVCFGGGLHDLLRMDLVRIDILSQLDLLRIDCRISLVNSESLPRT
jgi:hypothetical protein